ncbi:MAG: hypothetical protein AB9880_12130 [Christensenellales bacterium]
MKALSKDRTGMQRAGGIASLFIALAYLAAIPYFVFMVAYPGVTDPVRKILLLRDNFTGMYLMHILSFELPALALIVLTVSVCKRWRSLAPSLTQLASAIGLIRAGLLLASVLIFNYGADTVVRLYADSPEQAMAAWQTIEPVALALGGTGNELLGGVWTLLLSAMALRAKEFPKALSWLGAAIGVCGVLSSIPALGELETVFGLLQIVWFFWLGIVMLRAKEDAAA